MRHAHRTDIPVTLNLYRGTSAVAPPQPSCHFYGTKAQALAWLWNARYALSSTDQDYSG